MPENSDDEREDEINFKRFPLFVAISSNHDTHNMIHCLFIYSYHSVFILFTNCWYCYRALYILQDSACDIYNKILLQYAYAVSYLEYLDRHWCHIELSMYALNMLAEGFRPTRKHHNDVQGTSPAVSLFCGRQSSYWRPGPEAHRYCQVPAIATY